ncbi:MAG: hypothetical protein ACK5DD_13950 [Cyclobacteriaceae bacterium]
MRSYLIKSFLFWMFFAALFAQCSQNDDEADQPAVTKPYYIKFKFNGVTRIFESQDPGYQSCGACACCQIPPLGSPNADVSICQANNNFVTAANIESWNGRTILWDDATFPYSSFDFEESGISYASYYAADQTGSELRITKVEYEGLFVTKRMYKVTGTFKCKVAKSDGSSISTVTEGEFVVRYSEF